MKNWSELFETDHNLGVQTNLVNLEVLARNIHLRFSAVEKSFINYEYI